MAFYALRTEELDSSPTTSPSLCRQSIDKVVDLFDVKGGRAAIQADGSLWSMLLQCFARLSATFKITDPKNVLSAPTALPRMLQATFDTDAHAFLSKDSSDILSHLDESDKARLMAQAVAGLVLIFHHLEGSNGVSPSRFDHELQLFADSEQRSRAIHRIEASKLFGRCYLRSQISDLIMDAVEGRDDGVKTPSIPDEEDYQSVISWATELPPRNMGLPWGFSIMALN